MHVAPRTRHLRTPDLSTAHRNTEGEAVSRAYYKMREVRARCACVPADLATLAAAIDVGAAPGGWTACLAKAGVRRVVYTAVAAIASESERTCSFMDRIVVV